MARMDRKMWLVLFVTLTAVLVRSAHGDYYYSSTGATWSTIDQCTSSSAPCKGNVAGVFVFPPGSVIRQIDSSSSSSVSMFTPNSTGELTFYFGSITNGLSMTVQAYPATFISVTFYSSVDLNSLGDLVFVGCSIASGTSWYGTGVAGMSVLFQNANVDQGNLPDFSLPADAFMRAYTILDTTIQGNVQWSPSSAITNVTFERVTILVDGPTQTASFFSSNQARDIVIIRDCSWQVNYYYGLSIRNTVNILIENSYLYSSDSSSEAPVSLSPTGQTFKKKKKKKKKKEDASDNLPFFSQRRNVATDQALTIINSRFERVKLYDATMGADGLSFNAVTVFNSTFTDSWLYITLGTYTATVQNNTFAYTSAYASYAHDSLFKLAVPTSFVSSNTFPTTLISSTIAAVRLAYQWGNATITGDLQAYDLATDTSPLTSVSGDFRFSQISSANSFSFSFTGSSTTLTMPSNGRITGSGLTLNFDSGAKLVLSYVGGSSFTATGTNIVYIDTDELELAIARPRALRINDTFTIISSLPASWSVAAFHMELPALGYAGDYSNSSNQVVFKTSNVYCANPCLNGGSCFPTRDSCSCVTPWSGPVCECTTLGQVGATVCNPQGGLAWITPAGLEIHESEHLDIPAGYSVQMTGDIFNNGSITVRPGTTVNSNGTLTNFGHIDISTILIEALGCPSSASVAISGLNLSDSGQLTVTIDLSRLDPSSSCASIISKPILNTANETFMSGKISIVVVGDSSRRGSISVLSTSNASHAISSADLAVSSTSPSGACSTVNSSPGFVSVFVTPCTPGRSRSKWYYWGAPVITILCLVAIVVVIVATVPSVRALVMPYKGSN